MMALGGLLCYLYETQKTDLSHIGLGAVLLFHLAGGALRGEAALAVILRPTRRNLELTATMRAKEKRGSLLWVLDRTKTAMGGRPGPPPRR